MDSSDIGYILISDIPFVVYAPDNGYLFSIMWETDRTAGDTSLFSGIDMGGKTKYAMLNESDCAGSADGSVS